jgi:hypothetical protein
MASCGERATGEVRGEVWLASCASECGIRMWRTMVRRLVVSDEDVASRSGRGRSVEADVTKSNRTAGGEVAKGIYEK